MERTLLYIKDKSKNDYLIENIDLKNKCDHLQEELKNKNFEIDKLNQIIKNYQRLTISMVLDTEKDPADESK